MEEGQQIKTCGQDSSEKDGRMASKTWQNLQRMWGEFRRERVEKGVLLY